MYLLCCARTASIEDAEPEIHYTYFRGHKFIAEAYEQKKRISVLDDETRIQYTQTHLHFISSSLRFFFFFF